ncbi:MAG: Type 1 glutamine amidotransferase-like domain-containing protein [Mycobacteriales bacterium]
MPADVPTILATSMGFNWTDRYDAQPGPVFAEAITLAGAPSRPKLCYVGTAGGDDERSRLLMYSAFAGSDVRVSHLALFPMPNIDDMRAHLLGQDVIWVGGGSVAGLLAMWALHGVGDLLREAWQAGVVLSGVSAGSICWHVGGTTDSFGPDLRPVTNGLALLPYANGVHYDSEQQRRPLFHRLIADGTLPEGYATDDGVGLVYRGTEFVEAVSDEPGAKAFRVLRGADGTATETVIEPRALR